MDTFIAKRALNDWVWSNQWLYKQQMDSVQIEAKSSSR